VWSFLSSYIKYPWVGDVYYVKKNLHDSSTRLQLEMSMRMRLPIVFKMPMVGLPGDEKTLLRQDKPGNLGGRGQFVWYDRKVGGEYEVIIER